jgi:vanillate O-demethylase ferredoxin subunit
VRQLASERASIRCTGPQGSQRPDLQALLATQPPGTTAYVCGPASMIDSTHQAAAALGWATGRVRSEPFTPPPTGEEVPFELELKKSGLTLQIGQHTSILETMAAAGLHPLFDCRRGECGLCPLPVLHADGPLQHRDSYLSSDEQASGQSLCICVSRVRGPRLVLNA